MSANPQLIEIGQLGRAHGVRGELRFFPADPDSELLEPGCRVFVREENAPAREFQLSGIRRAAKFDIISLSGVEGRDQAEALTNLSLLIDQEDLPELDEDEFYLRDLVGLEAVELRSRQGDEVRSLGRVDGIFETGANDVMVVILGSGERLLVPIIDEAIAELQMPDRVLLWPLADWAPEDTDI